MSTFFVLAGEASGDMHGARLLRALKEDDPAARFVGMGGPQMAAAGLDVAKDLSGMQVVGFWEVIKHYGFFKKVFYQLLDRVKQERPSALICIDYPGFNLRFAKEVRKLGIPILYYIVPQVWAWKPKRAAKMAEFVDRAYCVFEFEPPFFEKFRSPQRRMKTVFVGHPILDRPPIPKVALGAQEERGRRTVSFLTGSRQSEFVAHGMPMAKGFWLAKKKLGDLDALMSVPGGMDPDLLARTKDQLTHGMRNGASAASNGSAENGVAEEGRQVWVGPQDQRDRFGGLLDELSKEGRSHASLLPAHSDFSVVKSGTSTLEAGLQGNPMCVVYRGGWMSYAIARMLVDIPVFSLVNIVLGRYAVTELLQSEVCPERIALEIERGLTDKSYQEERVAALAELPGKLGGPGASKRAAEAINNFLNGKE